MPNAILSALRDPGDKSSLRTVGVGNGQAN